MGIHPMCIHLFAFNGSEKKPGMAMQFDDKFLDEIEQHAAAERVLLNILRIALTCPGAMDTRSAVLMLSMAADERQRQGDYTAADLLSRWKTLVASWN